MVTPDISPPGRVLVVGGDSLIGTALCAACARAGWDVRATTRRGGTAGAERLLLDLEGDDWGCVTERSWDVVFLVAAVARLNDCTRDPERARRVNVTATVDLARRLSESTRTILLSTNQVFDGAQPRRPADAPRNPSTRYGELKALAEDGILALPRSAVVRLSKVIGAETPPFADWLATLSQGEEELTPFHDMTLAPVDIGQVTGTLMAVAATHGQGIYQLSGPQDVSYADFAHGLADRLGVPRHRVRPISWRDSGALLQPPALFSSLDTSRIRGEFGIDPWGPDEIMDRLAAGVGRRGA